MKKLTPSGYVPASETAKPGYLAAKFAKIRRELKEADARQSAINKEAAAKVAPISKPRRSA